MKVLVVMADSGNQVRDVVVVQRIADLAALLLGADDPRGTQKSQLVAGGARGESSVARELIDGALADDQRREDPQTAGRGERSQRLRKLLGVLGVERRRGAGMLGWVRHHRYNA